MGKKDLLGPQAFDSLSDMTAPILQLTMDLTGVGEEIWFSAGQCESHPLAESYVSQFDRIDAEWVSCLTARFALLKTISRALGRVHGADDRLDDLVDSLHSAVLAAVKNDRTAALYLYFFGVLSFVELKRPVLGEELTTIESFLGAIKTSPVPTIAILGPEFEAAVAVGKTATADLAAAAEALRLFDTIGGKKLLIDSFNSLRQQVWGELAVMRHDKPELMLPSDFADRVFMHETQRGINSVTSASEVARRIEVHERALHAAVARRDHLKAKSDAKAAKKAAQLVADTAVKAAKDEEKAAKQKVKEAEKAAKAAKKNPPTPATPATPTTT